VAMNNFILEILPEEATYALGLMLLHMLWQGLVIALTLGFFLLLMRSASAPARYNISLIALVMLPLSAVATFFQQLNMISQAKEYSESTYFTTFSQEQGSLLDAFLGLYTNYLPLIVFLWFLGICVLVLKNLGGFIYLERLKKNYVVPATEPLIEVVEKIRQKFAIARPIQTLISSRINSPMVIGHFKPVVLIPGFAMEQLSPKEMEVVLHHELAHIKRNDYLVNIFQIVIEILFFFHPAAWWISGIIRKEREECCDNYAIADEKDKIILAKTLTYIQELNLKLNPMALSFMNNKKGLLNRIKNLFGTNPKLPSYKEGVFVTLFFFSCLIMMSFVFVDKDPGKAKETFRTVNAELPGGEHLFAKVDGEGNVDKLFVEGKKVKPKNFKHYKPFIDSLMMTENQDEKPHEEVPKKGKTKMKNKEKHVSKGSGSFNMDIDDKDGKVSIRAGEGGFKLYVNDENETVEMNFNEKGGFMKIIENGKTIVDMSMGEDGFDMSVND
jgi:beta-lactamase regulating signal transducer with metallopeptidase domain